MSNIKIERHNAPVEENIRDGVLDLVSANVTSLNMTHPPVDHPKFEAYRVALVLEVMTYLAMKKPYRIELVTASSDGLIVGFTLCGLPLNGSTSECGVYYTAVAKAHRGKGLMSLMMNDITARYPSVALSCDVELVPRYERYGFRCDSVRHHQVVMFIGSPVEETPVLSVPDLMNNPSVMAEREKAESKFSSYEIDRADRALAKRMQADEEKAKRFLKARNR
ncbi:GNAT family N-acetyltransferase [Pseudomonas veronii]